ncbi:MAG: hypothetical protein BACD_01699 [Bacteroides rodentium]|jgi:hypothetical protein
MLKLGVGTAFLLKVVLIIVLNAYLCFRISKDKLSWNKGFILLEGFRYLHPFSLLNTFDAMSFGSSEFKLYQLGYPNQELKEGFLIQLGGNFFFFHIDNVLVNSNDEDMSELTYPHLSFISACPNTVSRLPNNNSLRSSGECQFPNREAGNPLSALI